MTAKAAANVTPWLAAAGGAPPGGLRPPATFGTSSATAAHTPSKGAKSRTLPLSPKSAPRRRYAGAMPTIGHCPGCPYREFGPAMDPRGHPANPIVLVGEAPGAKEIAEGRPFVGPAGDVLWAAVADAGLSEAHLFITNAVACQPRPVHLWVRAIDACRGRVVRDIEAFPRAVVVTLGATAFRAVTGQRGFRMSDVRGRSVESNWGPVVPTLHPARVRRVRRERRYLVEDLALARRIASSSDGAWTR